MVLSKSGGAALAAAAALLTSGADAVALKPAFNSNSYLARSVSVSDASRKANATASAPPCQCQPTDAAWKAPALPRPAGCYFFDLGAGNGETFLAFLGKSAQWQFNYDTAPFAKDQCSSFLLEANPKFQQQLTTVAQQVPGKVFPMAQQAIYMCDKAEENFYLDLGGGGPNAPGWGSSLDGNHASVKNTLTPVKVKINNLMRLLKETVTAEDTVVVKMDIEGAEFDILPCLAQAPEVAKLIDTLYLENHCPTGSSANGAWCPSTGQAGNTKAVYDQAVASLLAAGIKMPQYWSPML